MAPIILMLGVERVLTHWLSKEGAGVLVYMFRSGSLIKGLI